MKRDEIINEISNGQAILGIELGSTRIKAVLIASDYTTVAEGSFGWENHLEGGLWSYYQEEIFEGLKACYANLLANVKNEYGIGIETLKSRHFCWNLISPTASTSSMIIISLSKCAATAKASFTYIPLEYRFTGVSINFAHSENSIISSIFESTSFLFMPRMAPFR